MHELSIVEALIDQVECELQRAGQTGRIKRLDLLVGRLAGVHCDSIRFAFDLLSQGTIVEGAEMHITQHDATCCCHACSTDTRIDALVVECPRCRSGDVSIEGGREIILESIEIED